MTVNPIYQQVMIWGSHHTILVTIVAVLTIVLPITFSFFNTRKRYQGLNDYVIHRGYHFINSEVYFIVEQPLPFIQKELSSPRMQRGCDGIADIHEFQQRHYSEALAFSCHPPEGEVIVFQHRYSSSTSIIQLKVAKILCQETIPSFRLEKQGEVSFAENPVNKTPGMDAIANQKPVNCSEFPEFARHYCVMATDPAETKNFLKQGTLRELEQIALPGVIVTNEHYVVYFERGRFLLPASYDAFIANARAAFHALFFAS
jgi:hypothetical protein